MGGKKPLRRPLWPPTRATASNYYPLGLDGAGGAAKPLLRAPKKPAPLHGRLPAFSGAVDAFERARKCFLEWRYFFSIILSEFLKNRVALHLPRVYRLLPIIVLVIMIIMGYSLPRSAIYCTIFSIIIAAISPETRMGPRKLLQTLMDGVRQAANIAIPTAACGIMIGIVVNSGVAVKIAKLIGTSGEGSLFIALLIAALGCLLLGMALPTVAAYLIAVTLFASAIQGLGISALVTNMFIFYFGVVAQITPPVCLASFTAAGIAGASAWKTGWKAFSFAITAFIVPFAFVYRPAILLEGTMVEIIIAYCIVVAATYLLACGIAGYLFRPLKMWERIACYVVAFIFILPSSMSDIIGVAGCALIMAYCFMTGKKNANKAQPA